MALCTDSYSKPIISSINYTTCMKQSDGKYLIGQNNKGMLICEATQQ
jgi:hypothetical protein